MGLLEPETRRTDETFELGGLSGEVLGDKGDLEEDQVNLEF